MLDAHDDTTVYRGITGPTAEVRAALAAVANGW